MMYLGFCARDLVVGYAVVVSRSRMRGGDAVEVPMSDTLQRLMFSSGSCP